MTGDRMEKAIFVRKNTDKLNALLEQGWTIKSTTPSHTAAAMAGDQYSQKMKVTGRILVILEKEEK